MAQWIRKIKKRTRPFRHWLLWKFCQTVEMLLRSLPPKTAVDLGAILGRLAYYLDFGDRERAIEHLTQAYGDELTANQRRRIARGVFENFGRSTAELSLARKYGAAFLKGRYTITNSERFKELVRNGHGLVVATPHMDNWEMGAFALTHMMEIETMAVAQYQTDKMIEEWLDETRALFGIQIHKRGADARFLLKSLREGKVLLVLLDQDTGGVGCFTPFFGRPAFTLLGPAMLAIRSKTPFIIGFSYRNPDTYTHTIHLTDPIEPPPEIQGAGRVHLEKQAVEMTRQVTAAMEAAIRKTPDQWVWFHRRWRRSDPNRQDINDPSDHTARHQFRTRRK